MTGENLKTLHSILNGSNEAYIELLLNNDKEQFLEIIKKANYDYFLKNEAIFSFSENKAIAEQVVRDWKLKKIILPKIKFIPANNSYFEVIERLKLIRNK